eukprot:TRINITY_DN4868_c0_g1_i1.p1 TRINITY_DN4868_c0_g1~~TRINITY_DN4868_c0_g1_i1.p1  ORF type:complete len:708 (+),score=31.08 TRINITY_DN4868_c0_g1_i1:1542-3665(+)
MDLTISQLENQVECQSPLADAPGIGHVELFVMGVPGAWTNSLPFEWYNCTSITTGCNECITPQTPLCKWCVEEGCAVSCQGVNELSVCPIITDAAPTVIRANFNANQVVIVNGGPFPLHLNYSCQFDDIPADISVIDEKRVHCLVPVFIVSPNPVLTIYANGVPYTNSITLESYECLQTPENYCTDTCQNQEYCGWCVTTSSCVGSAECSVSEVFLDECISASISPSVFDPRYAEKVTITIPSGLPQAVLLLGKKRGATQLTTFQCLLSTGEIIDAALLSATELSCDLPALPTDQSITLAVIFTNRTLIAPIGLEVVACSERFTCNQCSQLDSCSWCDGDCTVNYRCSNPTDCGSVDIRKVTVHIIVPAVIVPIVVVAVGLTVLFVLLKRRTRKQAKKTVTVEMPLKSDGNYGTIDGTVPSISGNSGMSSVSTIDNVSNKMKIPSSSLQMTKEIGAGSYGKVFLGLWQGARVAIKVCATMGDTTAFFEEAALTIELPPHPNVVQTFGISVDGPLPCIVLEYCGGGSLDKKLFDQDTNYSLAERINMIKGIARGLLHLHKHNIIHRDLAARNILLAKSGDPKISDFGMSRLLKEETQKGQTNSNVGPIRWMAPESLREKSYSTKSDVWSFGIFAYEVLSGSEPHTDMDPFEVAIKIKNDSYHPVLPNDWNVELRNLLISCWQPLPASRPSMEQVNAVLNANFVDEDSL